MYDTTVISLDYWNMAFEDRDDLSTLLGPPLTKLSYALFAEGRECIYIKPQIENVDIGLSLDKLHNKFRGTSERPMHLCFYMIDGNENTDVGISIVYINDKFKTLAHDIEDQLQIFYPPVNCSYEKRQSFANAKWRPDISISWGNKHSYNDLMKILDNDRCNHIVFLISRVLIEHQSHDKLY